MKVDELREKYLAFYESQGHTRCPSDVLVPTWDRSVLFTPAGMNQFKDHFLGKVKLDFTRATTCQKCLRTGDIDNVGRTAYHHTFFEMLGNFSFGDYFKRDAITTAWEFLTSPKWLGIDEQRLTVTVYLDDDEAANIWADEIGLPTSRIERMGEGDNFWPANAPSQGPDGVCGPCSEIFYKLDGGGDVEIWNLVFTQFERVGDPPDNLRPLPSKNIDTGMGLERAASVLQGVDTNFHIDTLLPIVEAAAEVCGVTYEPGSDNGRRLRRITDHVRACTFAVHENVYPGPNREKYVVKRLLRRAVLDGHQMGRREPFLNQLVPAVVERMAGPYPELRETVERVAQVIRNEEEAFFGTIDAGLERIQRIFASLKSSGRNLVDGANAAELYQTHGIPPELVEAMAAEEELAFDWDGFRLAMEQHGIDSGGGRGELFATGPIENLKKALQLTEFVGYESECASAEVKGIVVTRDGEQQMCEQLESSTGVDQTVVILDSTSFYAEAGGQVGDTGAIVGPAGKFVVQDTQKDGDLILHYGHVDEGVLNVGDTVQAEVDSDRRQGIRRAHSATHILHHALQASLGAHAQQQGSKVDRDWLRFDFTNMAPVGGSELAVIEGSVRERVAAAAPIDGRVLPLAEARQQGAMMLFGEKYPDPVRMISMGDFSRELCGGTHLSCTGDVGQFEIIAEEAVSAGTRRIVALTGDRAEDHATQTRQQLDATASALGVESSQVLAATEQLSGRVRELKKCLAGGGAAPEASTSALPAANALEDYQAAREVLRETARLLNVSPFDVAERIVNLQKESAALEQQLTELSNQGDISADTLMEDGTQIGDALVVVAETPGAPVNHIRQWIDQVRKKAGSSAVLLMAGQGADKVVIVAGLSPDLVKRGANAGQWVKAVAEVAGGRGGGRPDMAQAGGKDPAAIPAAIAKAEEVIREMLGAS